MKLLEQEISAKVSLRNILYATDFSAVSEAALPYATAISCRYGSMIHVAHIIPESNLPVRPGAPDSSTLGVIYEDAPTVAQETMLQLTRRLKGFPYETHIRHGQAWEVLAEIIRENEIDLLIAGTHGRTGVGRLVMGSVAEEIFRHVSCPVLTVGPKVRTTMQSKNETGASATDINFQQILYATDFTPHSLAAASYASSLAQEFRTQLTLLHVIEQYGEDLHDKPGPIEDALRRLENLRPEMAALPCPSEPAVEFGPPADCILQMAAEREADLIVLGVRAATGRLGASTHLALTTAHKILAKAHCPVLTIRMEDADDVKSWLNRP